MTWKWNKGADPDSSDFGHPTTTTDYRLCVYDGTGGLIMNLAAPAGGTCSRGKPCWKETRSGFTYKNNMAALNELTALTLKSGAPGKAKVAAKAGGMSLTVPPLPLAQAPGSVRVQLINSTTAACWEASFSAPAASKPDDMSKWKDTND